MGGQAQNEHTDEELMLSYVDGAHAAFEELYLRLRPWLLRMMEHQLACREDAGDLVQQAFLQLHQARFEFDRSARVRPWLATIALNLKRGYFRRRKRRPEQQLPESAVIEDEAIRSGEEAVDGARLRDVLTTLPPREREVIVLHYFGGFSYPEIVQMTGVGLSAVKQRASRAYARLRETIEPGAQEELAWDQ